MKEFKEIPASKRSIAMRRKVLGVGINDAEYLTQIKVVGKFIQCPFYRTWVGVLYRCYSDKLRSVRPTYSGCSVSSEWLTFSRFKEWMQNQDWRGKQIDKDIIVTGNKVYSPDKCIFVSSSINNLIIGRRDGVCGVNYDKFSSSFHANCSVNGKKVYLGSFTTESEAGATYKRFKSNHILSVANKQQQPLKGYLLRIAEEILNQKESTK